MRFNAEAVDEWMQGRRTRLLADWRRYRRNGAVS
jgi:hypothetical protein